MTHRDSTVSEATAADVDRHHQAYSEAMSSVRHAIAQFNGCSQVEKTALAKELADLEAISQKLEMGRVEIVLFGEMAAIPGTGVDVLMGTGGTPEGIIAAAAVKALGGGMQALMAPQNKSERKKIKAELGVDTNNTFVLTLDDLIKSEDAFFAADKKYFDLYEKAYRQAYIESQASHFLFNMLSKWNIWGKNATIQFDEKEGILYAMPVLTNTASLAYVH